MYEEMTYEAIREEMLAYITLTDKREGSFANDIVSSGAYEGEKVWAALRSATGIFFLEDCTGEYCDRFAGEYGLTRKEGKKAKGNVTFTGEENTEIPLGTMCATPSGLIFLTTAAAVVGSDGSVTVPVEAADIGDRYNILAGYINTLPVAIQNITSVTNAEGFLGGTETETDEELIARLLLKKRTPATSGNTYHYLQWALEVAGVGNAKVFPLDDGPGTVGVMVITSSGRAPGADVLEAAAAHIEEVRPIGATVSVYAPTETQISATATLTISEDTTIEAVKTTYTEMIGKYIKDSVFVLTNVDYYKCLSMFYDIPGVVAVNSFNLNDGESNIVIAEKAIQVLGNITITEVTE